MKKYKNFGFSFGIALAVLGALRWFFDKPHYLVFYIVSLVILLLALTFPIVLKPLFVFFNWLATVIGWIITTLVLILLFYLVITPIGLIMRARRKDFMGNKRKDSYWNIIKKQDSNPDCRQAGYEQQY